MSESDSLRKILATAVADLRKERPDLRPGEIEEAASRLCEALDSSGIDYVGARVLAARSSVILEVKGQTGVFIIKAPVLRRHASLEAAALSAWGNAGLTPRLLSWLSHYDVLTMTVAAGAPLYLAEQEPPSRYVAMWYARCHRMPPLHSGAFLSTEAILTEWEGWLVGNSAVTRANSHRAIETIRRAATGLECVMTHGDPNRGNFLYDAAGRSLSAVDPLPCLLPVEVIVARAALQTYPEAPAAFLSEAQEYCAFNLGIARDMLPPLAVLSLDWNQSDSIVELAAQFRGSSGQ